MAKIYESIIWAIFQFLIGGGETNPSSPLSSLTNSRVRRSICWWCTVVARFEGGTHDEVRHSSFYDKPIRNGHKGFRNFSVFGSGSNCGLGKEGEKLCRKRGAGWAKRQNDSDGHSLRQSSTPSQSSHPQVHSSLQSPSSFVSHLRLRSCHTNDRSWSSLHCLLRSSRNSSHVYHCSWYWKVPVRDCYTVSNFIILLFKTDDSNQILKSHIRRIFRSYAQLLSIWQRIARLIETLRLRLFPGDVDSIDSLYVSSPYLFLLKKMPFRDLKKSRRKRTTAEEDEDEEEVMRSKIKDQKGLF